MFKSITQSHRLISSKSNISRLMSSSTTIKPPVVTLKHLLFYEYVDDILEKRNQYRAEHFALALEAVDKGIIEQAGAYQNPTDGATFLFNNCQSSDIEAFVQSDPYYKNGLVTKYSIKEWTVVVAAEGKR